MLLHKKWQIYYIKIIFSHSFLSPLPFLSPENPLSPVSSFLHQISSLRRRHRPAKPPPRSTDLGLLTFGLERRRTGLEAFESAAEPHAPPAFLSPFWPRHSSDDLPPARPCSEAPFPGQIEAEQRHCRAPSAWAIRAGKFSLIAVVTPCRTSGHSSCHKWAP